MVQTLKNERVAVAGLGARTGVSLVRYLCSAGAHVCAYDIRSKSELQQELEQLQGYSFELECGTKSPSIFRTADYVLLSPGVPIDMPFLVEAQKQGIPVHSEIELSSSLLKCPLIAITGTNGKSTTTTLLGHLLKESGKNIFVGGNLGTPLVDAVGKHFDLAVVEVSSFQLEGVESFHPMMGILLNVTENHLDRHKTFQNYFETKARLFGRMTEADTAILNADDPHCVELSKRLRCKIRWFSQNPTKKVDAFVRSGEVCFQNGATISLRDFSLIGSHNQENAAAALLAAKELGCSIESLEQGLALFQGLPHRLEKIGRVQGVEFVNDSKSTTPGAAVRALQSFNTPILWLAGGKGKGASYTPLKEVAQKIVKHAFLYGEASDQMCKDLKGIKSSQHSNLQEAFRKAVQTAEEGDTVLLSPANASFDQFKDFEERGDAFRKLAEECLRRGGN